MAEISNQSQSDLLNANDKIRNETLMDNDFDAGITTVGISSINDKNSVILTAI